MAEQGRTDRAAWEGEMFRLLAENVLDYALFIVDPHRHVLSWSKGAERLLGFTEAEIVGQRCDLFFTPEDVRAGVPQKELDEALASGRGDDDRWHVRKDGSRFWASGAVTPLRDEGGTLRGFAKIMRDRTDMRRAEEELSASRRRLQALFDNTLDAILLADDHARYVDANPAACELLGYDREELLQRGVFDITPPPDGEAGQAAWATFIREGKQEGEYAVRRKDGTTAVVEYRAVARILPGLHLSVLRDVSDRRRAERSLRESEERLRAISDNLPNGAVYQVIGDPEGRRRFVFISAGVERLFGVTPAEALADADTLYGLVHEEDRARVAAAEEVALRDSAPFDCEFRSRTRSGGLVWVHARSAPRPLPTGQVAWEGIIMDVTERRRAERRRAARLAVPQALAEAATVEEAARHVLQALCGGLGWDVGAFWRVDSDGQVLRCVEVWHEPAVDVPDFEAMTRQITLGPGVGLPGRVWVEGGAAWMADVVRDANFPRAATARQEGLRGACGFPVVLGDEFLGVIEFFSREVREPDADLLEMMATVGSQVGQFMERKRAEEELRRSERELADFFDNATMGLHWVGPDGTILRVNKAELDLLGYAREEYVGHHIAEFHADEGVICDILRRLTAGEKLWDYEARMRCKDGSIKHVLIDSSVLWEDGQFVHTRCFTRDVTRQKQAEQALREADKRKDEFLATLAHELRNPLAPLRNGLQVMKLAAGNAEAVEQSRAMMERQLGQMVHLIDDLLDVSRITRGKLELRKQRVELAGVVQSAIEGSRPLIEASAHRLTVALPPEPVYLEADPTRLAQVFTNLLTNAAKYTDKGGHIRLTAERHGGGVVVSVRDTGIGIAAEHLPRLFEMFSQVAPALERSQGGLGIGLSLVKGLVEMHGGSVEARSEGPGRGSEFAVRLPVAGGTPGPEPPHPGGGPEATARPRRRILVADDNRDAADSLAMMLRLQGHEVHAVHDGLEALEAAAWFRPDVALLDIGMPRVNGFEAARRIREQAHAKGMVLVAVTGWGQEDDKRRATEAGFDHHLTKPVAPAALSKLLDSAKRTDRQ